ncbi:PASTA domain-containing protein [Streptomyces sp. O3]
MTDLHTEPRTTRIPLAQRTRRTHRRPRPWGLVAAALSVALLGACSDGSTDDKGAGTAATAKPTPTVTLAELDSQKGATLRAAQDTAEAAGYTTSAHNASEGAGTPSGTWKVCFETVRDGAVDFGAVQEGALCPAKDGGPLTWPDIPDVTGHTYARAVATLTEAGVDEEAVRIGSAYEDLSVSPADVADSPTDYTVCFQSPEPGADVKPDTKAALDLVEGGSCPSEKGTYKDKTNDPAYTPPPPSKPADSTSGGTTSGGTATSGGSGTGGSGTSGSGTSGGDASSGGSGGTGGWNGQCELTSPAGNCYRAGQFCANKHVGMRTHDANGRIIYCKERASGQRWNYS